MHLLMDLKGTKEVHDSTQTCVKEKLIACNAYIFENIVVFNKKYLTNYVIPMKLKR